MTGRRSEKHSVNVHPDDFANLEEVRDKLHELLKVRLQTGVTVSFISRSLGHRHEFMNQIVQPFGRDTYGWLYDSFHDLSLGCLAVPRVKIFGLDGFTTPMWEIAKSDASLLGVGALDVLKKFRQHQQVTEVEMARRLGVVKSNIHVLDNADNPYMGSIQRYARALNLIVRFNAIKWLNGDPRGYR